MTNTEQNRGNIMKALSFKNTKQLAELRVTMFKEAVKYFPAKVVSQGTFNIDSGGKHLINRVL